MPQESKPAVGSERPYYLGENDRNVIDNMSFRLFSEKYWAWQVSPPAVKRTLCEAIVRLYPSIRAAFF